MADEPDVAAAIETAASAIDMIRVECLANVDEEEFSLIAREYYRLGLAQLDAAARMLSLACYTQRQARSR